LGYIEVLPEIEKKLEMIKITSGKLKKQADIGSSRVLKTPIPAHPTPSTAVQSDILACESKHCKFFVSVTEMLQIHPDAQDPPKRGKVHTLCKRCRKAKRTDYVANKPVEDPKKLYACASRKCYVHFKYDDAEYPGSPFCTYPCHQSYNKLGE